MKTSLIIFSITTLFTLQSLSAAALMVNFRATGGPTLANLTNSPLHADQAGFSDTVWNNTGTGDVAADDLLWSDNTTATGVALNLGAVTDSTSSQVVDLSTNPSTANNLGSQTSTGIYTGDSVGKGGIFNGISSTPEKGLGLQITGLGAGTYDIYLSSRNTNSTTPAYPLTYALYAGTSGTAGNFNYSTYDSASITFSGTGDATSAWVEAGASEDNYAKFTVTLDTDDVLNIAADGTARGFLNSMQIIAIPEPSSVVLMICGGITFLFCRRKMS